ncbi:MAG: Clp protease N-terminal domain-containing protein, partial [Brachybacterium tyrofermentans]
MEFQFTTRSQEAVTAAAEKAVELGNPQISSMHLLWVLATQQDGIGRAVLTEVGADPQDVARRAEQAVLGLPQVSGSGASGSPTFVGTGYDALDAARREADAQHRTYLSTEHLMIGIALGKDAA